MQGSNLAGDLEQLEDPARTRTTDYSLQGSDLACNPEQLDYPARPVVEAAERGDNLGSREAAPYPAALPESVVEAAEDEPDAGDAALYRQLFTNLFRVSRRIR